MVEMYKMRTSHKKYVIMKKNYVQETAVADFIPRSYSEDLHLENGKYLNLCIQCNHVFVGHKNRAICKVCLEENLLHLPDFEGMKIKKISESAQQHKK